MFSRKDFEQFALLPLGSLENFTRLQKNAGALVEEQQDIPLWHEKLLHIEKQIPQLTKDQYVSRPENNILEGNAIFEVDGISWHVVFHREPFLRPHDFVNDSGLVQTQSDWSFQTISTPTRTPEEKQKANMFVKEYGNAFYNVLLRRTYEAKARFGPFRR
jgi:hypothetical protein